MKENAFRITERRLWNEAVREGLLDKSAGEDPLKVRKALDAVAKDVRLPGEIVLAVAEVLSYAVAELELRLRVNSATHRKAWAKVLDYLPEEAQEKIAHEIRTLTLKDVSI
jgi:predicted Ser/Thr protein kinase